MEKKIEHICYKCDKKYKNYKSLWKHNYNYHKVSVNENVNESQKNVNDMSMKKIDKETKIYNCRKCNKIFNQRQGRWAHEKICKNDKNEDIIELKNKLEQLEKKIKISNKTINNNNGNINNGITNNIHINALGFENIIPKLNEKEKVDLLTGLLFKEIPHVELVRKIFTNEKFMEDRNTMITNLQTKTCMAFNKDTNKFGRGKPRSGP
jgi:hypothetical protein